ncbi:phosphotransferase [Cryobacterium sp. PH31-AA6]|uniref:maltokinase N-terminal cap-like domain-containing protein n=1 Tax=Cryobacterium sp. PH31-AA6 TaxID=3046205 RepID=UPI0024B967DE|nr:phosphotransferase [Cryobacterium sp. PH31-AA6]MDJ0325437.1 phosphotransferase [Cryobacterium sp. PH31-AA6]
MPENGRGTPVPDYLNQWVATQRWFASKGNVPALRSVAQWSLSSAEPGVDIRTHLVIDAAGGEDTLYQLPLTERAAPLPSAERALVAAVNGPDGMTRYVYDAPHDPAYADAILRVILNQGASIGQEDTGASARGELLLDAPDTPPYTVAASRVLTGEQSNTSIIFDTRGANDAPARPIICKVFRALHHGDNPDISVQAALARAGSRFVPEPIGYVEGEWDDPDRPAGRARGHLAFAQEFLPGVEDAWRAALTAASTGGDFSREAHDLGVATAAVHADLAAVMPTREATPDVIAAQLSAIRERFRTTAAEIPALGEHRAAIETIFRRAQSAPWPRLQRIHGDYHLGQVLNVPGGRGWVLVDFEGEPLRPLEDRSRPDVPLRDIAGMLRSFSYAAGTIELAHPERPASASLAWADACRAAFLDGYAERSGVDPNEQGALLSAFELDKALYEAVYETRNRPTWLPIPLAAITRLVDLTPSPRHP